MFDDQLVAVAGDRSALADLAAGIETELRWEGVPEAAGGGGVG